LPRKIGQEKAPTTVSIVHTPTPLSNHSHTNSNKVGTATPSFSKSLPVPAENESYDDFKARMAVDPGKKAADNSMMSSPTFVDVKF
jgi:hypothetical protein